MRINTVTIVHLESIPFQSISKHYHICDYSISFIKDVIQLNLINITNITIPINNPHTTINFNNHIQLPNNSYITRLSLLADAKIHNITSTQIVVIDGAQIIFNPGTWDMNQLMDNSILEMRYSI